MPVGMSAFLSLSVTFVGLNGGQCSSGDSHSLATGGLAQQLTLNQITGFGMEGFRWESTPVQSHIECAAKQKQDVVQGSYLALSQSLSAEPYWGQRIQLRGHFYRKVLFEPSFAALFIKVISGDGRTLVFDNMSGRRIDNFLFVGEWYSVVVDVPGPLQDEDSCPVDGQASLPAIIRAGFLVYGYGYAAIERQLILEVVPNSVLITGGLPPWEGPEVQGE